MIESVGNYSAPPRPEPKPLNEEQQSQLTTILSAYDADSLTSEDAKEIATQLKDVGINPGPAIGKAMSDAGFDAKEIGRLADAPPPPIKPLPEREIGSAEPRSISIQV